MPSFLQLLSDLLRSISQVIVELKYIIPSQRQNSLISYKLLCNVACKYFVKHQRFTERKSFMSKKNLFSTQNPHIAAPPIFFPDTLNVFQNLYKPLLLLFTFKT